MGSIGERLRQERLRKGLDLEEIGEQLRVSVRYLKAIEEDDQENLPAPFFYRSFVRQYARLLEITEREIEPELDERRRQEEASHPVLTADAEPHFEVPPVPTGMPAGASGLRRLPVSLAILVAVILGCSALYSLWLRSRVAAPATPSTPVPAPPPAEVAQRAGPPATTTQTPPGQPAAEPAAEPKPAEPMPPPPAEPQLAQPQPQTQSGPPASAGPPAQWLREVPQDQRATLEVTARDQVWISINNDGKVVFQNVMQTGQTRTFSGVGVAKITVGNAGFVQIRWKGESIGPIGPRGMVRVVYLSPEGAQIVNPRERKEAPAAEPPTAPAAEPPTARTP